jgi:(1->4)-alpha-D-glucan 1-alpha-D-glucosylmutase
VDRILDPEGGLTFLRDFRTFEQSVAWYGMLNGLSQTVLKLTLPGVPDIYQGSELWNYAMVDPDNRRTVDFGRRIRMLEALDRNVPPGTEVDRAKLSELLENWQDARIKLLTVSRLLNQRRSLPELFERGEYVPLRPSGEKAKHICAFARRLGDKSVLVIAPRQFAGIAPPQEPPRRADWTDTAVALADGIDSAEWTDVITGARHKARRNGEGSAMMLAGELLGTLPVSVLTSKTTAQAGT